MPQFSPARFFPVLGKELTEQAARRRTYVMRVLFALGLFMVFGIGLRIKLAGAGDEPLAVLGEGGDLFSLIAVALFVGIYLFLPAMMAGAIASERERGCLDLILITDMRPGQILLQKYVGRLLPFFGMLLLSLPVLAVAYSLGGMTLQAFWSGVYLLVLTCLQVGPSR